MKKITLLLAAFAALSCSGDDNNDSVKSKNYSAHMRPDCPQVTGETYDVCVSKAVAEYLEEQRVAAGINNCCFVSFEDINGVVYEDYLVRVEMNKMECPDAE